MPPSFNSPVSAPTPRPVSGPILGIESSCDETAVAVLDAGGNVLVEAVLSQQREHAPFGGVVPEIAARAHLAHLPALVREVLARAGVEIDALTAVAASAGPGLIGGLIVGSQFAKGIAIARGLPYVAVNHLEAHAPDRPVARIGRGRRAVSPLAAAGVRWTLSVRRGRGRRPAYRRLGATVDDAAGEAFDKVGKLLGLGWPGGPALERLALGGDPRRYAFPRPMLGREGCDFSFSGLKTAVAQTVARLPPGALPVQVAADIAAGFQAAVTDVLADRVSHAMAMMRGEASLLVVAGGVAANRAVRDALERAATLNGVPVGGPPVPPVHQTTRSWSPGRDWSGCALGAGGRDRVRTAVRSWPLRTGRFWVGGVAS